MSSLGFFVIVARTLALGFTFPLARTVLLGVSCPVARINGLGSTSSWARLIPMGFSRYLADDLQRLGDKERPTLPCSKIPLNLPCRARSREANDRRSKVMCANGVLTSFKLLLW